MDCLELNIHQRILNDIALNVGETPEDIQFANSAIAANVQTRDLLKEEIEADKESRGLDEEQDDDLQKVFMPASRAHCNIAFGELVTNFPESHINETIDTLMPVLIDILRDVPNIDFDKSLSWEDWALPDQLVYSTVSALLRITLTHKEHSDSAVEAIVAFVYDVVEKTKEGDSLDTLTQLVPAVHGLYRAISSTYFCWTLEQWEKLSSPLNAICDPEVVERLNCLLVDIIQSEDEDLETMQFAQTFMARYVSCGRPLSGYFVVCCVIETQWTILAQVLAPPPPNVTGSNSEAAAANKAWNSLMRKAAIEIPTPVKSVSEAMKKTIDYGMQCFNDLLVQIEEMESEPSVDTYAWETMSESLKLASICSVVLQNIDDRLFPRLLLLLSDRSPISDNLVQEAALKASTILVQNFPDIAAQMASHLRRFVTSPSPLFEFEFASDSRAPPPLSAAAKCLALSIKMAPGDDLMMSHMYSLLNYIAATSKEISDSNTSHFNNNPLRNSIDRSSIPSAETGLGGLSEDERRLVGITTISVVTKLALEFDSEEVTRLTVSMLLQRLRTAEPAVEAAIAYNLVDLAVCAPESAFIDIIRVFSTINRSANPDDPRFSNNMVLAAQTRLAQELHRRPELYELYLVELLTLFADKGVAIQNVKIANHDVKTDDMIEQLAGLLLPIDALLAHKDFAPQKEASPPLVSLFRNMWFLCILFHFTIDEKEATAMEWQRPALARIAAKTPATVLEVSHESFTSDVEYNAVIKQDYADTVIQKHRNILTKHTPLRSSDIRYLSCGQVIFLLTMHDTESMRSAAGLPSSLVDYFVNDSLNRHPGLSACMESIAEKVIRGCITELNTQASQQALPETLSSELQRLLVLSTHRIEKARDVAHKFLNRLITSFPSLMCDPRLVFAILETLTLLRIACENEFVDEFNPVHEFESDRTDITLQLTDSYEIRNEILGQLQRNANAWFELALGRAPIELQSTLQKYLAVSQTAASPADATELGATIAEKFGKAVGPVNRQLMALSNLSPGKTDKAKVLASQIAIKGYFAGEVAGLRLARRPASDKLEELPPKNAPSAEIDALKEKLANSAKELRSKSSTLTVHDMKRLLFRCAATLISLPQCDYELLHYLVSLPFEVATPPSISAAIEVWTWVIAEKPAAEVAIMSEILSAWSNTISQEKGVFSDAMNHEDPFYEPIGYSPPDKKEIDRETNTARRLISPHSLIIQMLFSRLQAARYRRPGVMFLIQHLVLRSARAHKSLSTHALARESRFSFLLFGFETLKSSHLDAVCESILRESLYGAAYSWFSVRPQWSYGSNRVQLDADVRVLSEFLSCLQTDAIRSNLAISSLAPAQLNSRNAYYAGRLREMNHPLRLLVENELFRLSVWANPANDPKRGADHISSVTEHTWTGVIRTVWHIDPAIAVHFAERFKVPAIRNEVTKLVRASSVDVLDVPEALGFLLGDRMEPSVPRDLKLLVLWAPVPPILATSFFEPRYKNDPLILQYAHRVLEQHPVDLTFFYVPQVVQALRYDDLGYVSQFIFETAKISQLFCHQIIWNMKANTHKDDLAEEEDPLKPTLDAMVNKIVQSLSGEARAFYDREFGFFHEVTSISGKLKPFIKRTKPEKKAKIDEEMAKIVVDVGVYLPSNPDGVVVDIDKKSGRPLQSHAKAPFMATFKVRKEKVLIDQNPDSLLEGDGAGIEKHEQYEVWQQAIFKVGDDCRQDVLALQLIAMFKNIFTSVGLTLYLFPYRVTATAPGCGVIDVVPNSTSRDEMGRAKVNDLTGFFVSKYGGHDTVAFQQARLNFIQSMAAYSLACYILQIKDRHNGNIMIDGEGHIVHIDFGFLFDIDKSTGVKFEPSSFKLNREMVELMGGRYSQGYHLFQQLTIKAFLAIRPHADQLVDMVQLMLDSSLPSFKGEGTIKRLRDRFVLSYNERQAADYMMGVIKNAHENVRSTAYDGFQRLQNGIPYK